MNRKKEIKLTHEWTLSSFHAINSGVLQGPVLAPTLFLTSSTYFPQFLYIKTNPVYIATWMTPCRSDFHFLWPSSNAKLDHAKGNVLIPLKWFPVHPRPHAKNQLCFFFTSTTYFPRRLIQSTATRLTPRFALVPMAVFQWQSRPYVKGNVLVRLEWSPENPKPHAKTLSHAHWYTKNQTAPFLQPCWRYLLSNLILSGTALFTSASQLPNISLFSAGAIAFTVLLNQFILNRGRLIHSKIFGKKWKMRNNWTYEKWGETIFCLLLKINLM